MNEKGEKTALLIDLEHLKQDSNSEANITEIMDDIEDILAIELSKKQNDYSDWDDAKRRLRDKGIID